MQLTLQGWRQLPKVLCKEPSIQRSSKAPTHFTAESNATKCWLCGSDPRKFNISGDSKEMGTTAPEKAPECWQEPTQMPPFTDTSSQRVSSSVCTYSLRERHILGKYLGQDFEPHNISVPPRSPTL